MQFAKRVFKLIVAAFVGLLLLCFFIGLMIPAKKMAQRPQPVPVAAQSSLPPQPAKPTLDKSEKAQADRAALCTKLMEKGIFKSVETGKVVVGLPFYALDFEAKQNFISVVHAWSFDGTNKYDTVKVVNVKTGKTIGTFSQSTGLVLE
jgi:hypothetical protein